MTNFDIIDKLMIFIIILMFGCIFINKTMKFGNNIASNTTTFKFVGNEYVILYNNQNYAIGSKFKINKSNIDIYAERVFKLDLVDKEITSKTFDKVNVIK